GGDDDAAATVRRRMHTGEVEVPGEAVRGADRAHGRVLLEGREEPGVAVAPELRQELVALLVAGPAVDRDLDGSRVVARLAAGRRRRQVDGEGGELERQAGAGGAGVVRAGGRSVRQDETSQEGRNQGQMPDRAPPGSVVVGRGHFVSPCCTSPRRL